MNAMRVSDVRARLSQAKGPEFWRSLEELADTPEFQKLLDEEFPRLASVKDSAAGVGANGMNRREFLSLISASLVLAGAGGCAATAPESIIPYVRQPEDIVPGKPLFFATAMPISGYGIGVFGESHMGRPTRVDGNPQHPDSLGASNAMVQASILSLYDPDRAQVIRNIGRISTWDSFITSLAAETERLRLNAGAGLRILTETVTSPTLVAQLRQLLTVFPSAQWHRYEPAAGSDSGSSERGWLYHFDRADTILSLDSDFLAFSPGHLRYARQFAARRRQNMNRLYVVETTPSITGAKADHRLAVRSSDIAKTAESLAAYLDGREYDIGGVNSGWVEAVGRDLKAHSGSSIVIAGPWQPIEVHERVRAINAILGNVGKTIEIMSDAQMPPAVDDSLRQLTADMQSGRVDLVLILGGNPVYTAPADLDFAKHLESVRLRIHLSDYDNETTEHCHWHIPDSHYLESWGDIRASDGTATIQQPLINPLYTTKSRYEVLSAFLGEPTKSTYEIVRSYWKGDRDPEDFERFWRKSVHHGVVQENLGPNSNFGFRNSDLDATNAQSESRNPQSEIEVVFRPDPTVLDGRFSNNAWQQELPKPLTKITWDNPALISPSTAERLGLVNEDVVELLHQGRSVKAPIWISPGHANDSITLFLGYGRTRAGRIGSDRGYNAYGIRTTDAMWTASSIEVRKTGERYPLVSTQQHQLMENRDIVRSQTVQDVPNVELESGEEPSLYPKFESEDYAWGMSIDLSTCIGCNACVIACQSENNIPSVGKDQVANNREMHWLRIDTYYKGSMDAPEMLFQPVPCMQCENAPCEPVCPVGATTHSAEGLNEMTYNRCVGTRYCSNNCPYKVRRFNFFQYANWEIPSLKLLQNPDVSVRSRGVMEKCTYCVQRINQARINAKREDRVIREGEVQTACQTACPAEAIVFGDIRNPESRVSRLKVEARNYALLEDLNTRPRTTYLARVTNPNPEM
jgi:MoCo/4Fe-4S cofactor protein with predicted Tat translocation signal